MPSQKYFLVVMAKVHYMNILKLLKGKYQEDKAISQTIVTCGKKHEHHIKECEKISY